MAPCECGCGLESRTAFLPGHDQKLRTALERRAGGLLNLRRLVEAAEEFGRDGNENVLVQRVRAVVAEGTAP